ncbi:MAG TPA: putative Ig domain-containing protein [Streptosporangiaceae bacterium]|nr:putative Ig domain-containing protein [Streptosporangiaceae bacterium]
MKRRALAVSAVAIASAALLPGTLAQASVTGGYTVSRVVVPSRVFAIAVDPSTGLAYAGGYGTARGEGSVWVINGASQAVEDSITVPGTPMSIAVDQATDTIYAASSSGLTVIDGATSSVITTITTASGGGFGQVAVDPATNTVYATGGTGIAVIDGSTNSITATVDLPGTPGYTFLAVDAATDTVYSGSANGSLHAIDGATDTVTNSAELGATDHITAVAVDSTTGSLYVAYDGDIVDVFSAATLAATTSIAGCDYHIVGLAADPTAGVVYATSDASTSAGAADSTCVIDAATNTVTETFPRGGVGVAADPVNGMAYIAAWYPLVDVWVAKPSATDELSPMDFGFSLDSPSATFAVGIPSSYPLNISALPAAILTETGALPAGVTMSPSGVFSGTPAAGTTGTYPITVSASNGVSPDSTVSLTVVVDIAPTITSPATATFQTGMQGSFTVQATGSPAPTVSAFDYGSWMTFTPGSSSGVLSGTPPPGSGGLESVYIEAQNGSGFTASQTLTITVNQPPAIAAASRLTFRVGRHVRYKISSTGFPAPVLSEHGSLPRGLTFRAGADGTALIVGKPARSDRGKRYRITIIASNHVGPAATKHVTIRIR